MVNVLNIRWNWIECPIAARSGDPFAVQRLLGHADLKMATRYVQDVCKQTDRVIENSRKYIVWSATNALICNIIMDVVGLSTRQGLAAHYQKCFLRRISEVLVCKCPASSLRDYAVAVFVRWKVSDEDWRRGDSNPFQHLEQFFA